MYQRKATVPVPPAYPTSVRVSHSRPESSAQKNSIMTSVKTNTAIAVWVVSCFVGHTTLRISTREPWMKCQRRYPWALVMDTLGVYGLMAMGTFFFVLAVGFVYEWKVGAMDW